MSARVLAYRRVLFLAGVLVVAFVLRIWAIDWGLYDANVSRRPHPDEWTVYWLLNWFGHYGSLSPCPQPGRQCFFDWGMAYPYLTFAFRALAGPFIALIPPATFGPHVDVAFARTILAGRLLSALISTATVYVTYRVGASAFSPGAGLAAAAVLAVSALLIQLAHFATPDSTTLLLMTLALWAAVHVLHSPSMRSYVIAGCAVGAAAGSEYHMGLLLVPLGCTWLLDRDRDIRHALLACLAALAVYVAINPYQLVHADAWLLSMQHTLRIRTVDSGAEYGSRWARFGPEWIYVVRYALGYGVGFALTAVMVAGVLWSAIRRRPADAVLLSWVGVYFLLATLSPAKFMRYSAPLIPPLAVLSGRLALEAFTARRGLPRLLVAAGAGAVLVGTTAYDAAYLSLFTLSDVRQDASSWLQRNAGPGALIAYQQLPNGLINLPYYANEALDTPCFLQFNRSRLSGPQRYLAVDSYESEEHPRFSDERVHSFTAALASSSSYHVADQITRVPSVFGIQISIAGSPHDWRYPAHDITIYKHTGPTGSGDGYCFQTLSQALTALYHPAQAG